jgi:diguanylate cyclase (GGDEF)-like protein/PAS domain S-box-containing protein
MLTKIPTLWRFLLPVLAILIVAPFLLIRQETSQQMSSIEEGAIDNARGVVRLMNVTDALMSDQVSASMRLLQERCQALGAPSIQGTTDVAGRTVPNLTLGTTSLSNHFDLVDGVTSLMGGTATLFVKSGHEFVRVSTNIRFKDHGRAIGTLLDPQGKAIAAIRAGQSFKGVVDILGEPYITRYEPIRSDSGELIGISYVGYKIDMQALQDSVENLRYLQNGFAAVVDHQQRIRFLSSHISPAQAFNTLQHPPKDWRQVSEEFPKWGFRVIVAYPMSEARALSLANSWFVIGGGTLLGILLVYIILRQLHRLILDPMGGDPSVAIEVVQKIAAGNFDPDGQSALPGTLMANVLRMRSKLSEMVSALRLNADRMKLSASVFEHANDGIFIADHQARIIEINPAFISLTGYERDESLGKKPQELGFAAHDEECFTKLQENGEWRGETWNQRKDGSVYAAWLDIFIVYDDQQHVSHYVGVFSDITSVKEHQQNLEHLAYHDPLTQLPNRTLLGDRLQQALARAARAKEMLAICYFDLDGFKPVNDTMGHEAGDRLLVQLASRVRSCLRESDTIARLGGDEFALLLCNLRSAEECKQTLDRLLAAINMPFSLEDQSVIVSASIGYTLYPIDESEPDTLLRHADQAMYQAKLNGGSGYHLFDAEHDRQTRGRRQERDRIEAALPNHEFRLHYQPKVNMRQGKVIGVEALIRWQHPKLGLRPPATFLPVIENTDFVIPLGEWVIQEALRQIDAWQKQGLIMHVSVNIAARHLTRQDFPLRLAGLLQEFPDVEPEMLELEITETAAIEDIAGVAQIINSCRLMGVGFSLDDFGVGYSSLTYLRRLPVETIKIDQSFVRDMLHDSDDLAVVAGVVSLSREFHRQVIAEGVETAQHGVHLLRMGCELAQGFGIARPMPPEDVPEWVRNYAPDASWDEGTL